MKLPFRSCPRNPEIRNVDKVIVTVLLIIGGVVAAFAVLNGTLPAIQRSSSAMSTATSQVNDQIISQIEIINTSTNGTAVGVWVKNVGTSVIRNVENCDVFLTDGNNVDLLPYGGESATLPYWNYALTGNSAEWRPTVTNEITLHLATLSSGPHQVKIVIPNGIFDQSTFGD
jgi:archaellum component FlaG (FlaF/FlaG flagellin family)